LTLPSLTLSYTVERWPIAGSFGISRGVKTEAVVVVAELADGKAHGRGECVPYLRYGETVESVAAQIERLRPQIEAGLDRRMLQAAMPPGAARNARSGTWRRSAAAVPSTRLPASRRPPR
jgi:L-alanine-DL-glutamate epimerase-like enolase superfamily enzyme